MGSRGRRLGAGRRMSAGFGSGPSQISVSGAMSTSPGHVIVPACTRTRRKVASSAAIRSKTGPCRRSVRSRSTMDPSLNVSWTDRPASGVTALTRSLTPTSYRRGSIGLNRRRADASSQSSRSSFACAIAHSIVNPNARGGRCPSRTRSPSQQRLPPVVSSQTNRPCRLMTSAIKNCAVALHR